MVKELIAILQEKNILRKSFRSYPTFEEFLNNLNMSQERKDSDLSNKKHVAFRPIDNLNVSVSDFRESLKVDQTFDITKSPQSKKNIAYSYSNKDLKEKDPTNNHKSFLGCKRTSIQLDPSQMRQMINEKRSSNESSAVVVGIKSPSSLSSMKAIQFIDRRNQKKLSSFAYSNVLEYKGEEKNKLKEHFSKTTQSSLLKKDLPTLDELSKKFRSTQVTPDNLHYSTSSNPCSKFFKAKRNEGKTYSSK